VRKQLPKTQVGRGVGGGHLMYPSKDFEKFGHKNAIKHENKGPPRFSRNRKNPPQKNLKMTVHLCQKLNQIFLMKFNENEVHTCF
jgi:hypothetical protein